MSIQPALILLTALPAEAKPVRRAFGLIRNNQFEKLALYRNDDMLLVITGVGKLHAQSAMELLLNHSSVIRNSSPIHWINYGIAGHPTLEVGEALEITSVTEDPEGSCYYPTPVSYPIHLKKLAQSQLMTVERPATEYTAPGCVDMEAATLFSNLTEYRPNDTFSCLKVISDNRLSGISGINGKQIEKWIAQLIPVLEAVNASLRQPDSAA